MSYTLHADGITWKNKFTPYDDIISINHHRMPLLRNSPYLKLKQKKVGFFSRPQLIKPKNIAFPRHPQVLTDIIPAILQFRPDLPVSPRIQRLLQNPELAATPRYWLIFIALIINIILAYLILQPQHQSLLHYLAIAGIFSIYPKFISVSALILPKTTRDCFLDFTLNSTPHVTPLLQGRIY